MWDDDFGNAWKNILDEYDRESDGEGDDELNEYKDELDKLFGDYDD